MKLRHVLAGASIVALLASAAQAQITMRLSHNAAAGNPKDRASERFAELVGEKSEGRITIQVGGAAVFGDDVESLTQMRLGTLELSANSQGPTSTIVPEFGVLGLPFLFSELETAWEVLDGEVGELLDQAAQEHGLKVLAFWDNGIRHVSNNVRPIHSPADLEGIRLRTPPDPVTIDIFEALGANPAPLAFSELYIALQQGVMDGQENPLMNIWSSNLHEVQRYISLTAHKYESTPLLISKIVWDGLSEEDREILLEAAREAQAYNRELVAASDDELRGQLEEFGIAFNEVDHEPFIEKTMVVWEEWEREFPDLVAMVRAKAGHD